LRVIDWVAFRATVDCLQAGLGFMAKRYKRLVEFIQVSNKLTLFEVLNDSHEAPFLLVGAVGVLGRCSVGVLGRCSVGVLLSLLEPQVLDVFADEVDLLGATALAIKFIIVDVAGNPDSLGENVHPQALEIVFLVTPESCLVCKESLDRNGFEERTRGQVEVQDDDSGARLDCVIVASHDFKRL
jgi:hypothetical protein